MEDTFVMKRPDQHLSCEWLLKWGNMLPGKLLNDLIAGLKNGFPTQYRGGDGFVRNYADSGTMKERDNEKAREKASGRERD